MEIASSPKRRIRAATRGDTKQLLELFQQARLEHRHADWSYPSDWIGQPGFLVYEDSSAATTGGKISACLAAAADPLPASWIRLAAARTRRDAESSFHSMIERIIKHHRTQGVSEIGWLQANPWPESLLRDLGFEIRNSILTYVKFGLSVADTYSSDISIRDATPEEMENLVKIEEAAFDPLWRHSERSLSAAFGQAICFQVAMIDDELVGFQYSVAGIDENTAHLVRITVQPEFQRGGIGSALLEGAMRSYQTMDRNNVTLNTQSDNLASHRLYEKYGFRQLGERIPLWVIDVV